MKMPFGKYRGCSVSVIQESYLRWLQKECDLYGDLYYAVEDALQYGPNTDFASPAATQVVDEGLLKQVYRRMAQKWHPDHGGDEAAMKAINDFYRAMEGRFG